MFLTFLKPRPTTPSPASDADDHSLVARVVAGDTDAFEHIMRRHNQRLFRIARSITRDPHSAEDALQNAYVRAYYKLPEYRPSGNFGAWLSRITVNEALMLKRNKHEQTNVDDAQIESLAGPRGAEPAEAVANSQLGILLERAIDRLPEHFRTVFVLRAVEHLSVADTAASLDLPAATVKTRYFRARQLMRKNVEQALAANTSEVFEFAGARCDRTCARVFERLGLRRATQPRGDDGEA